MTESWSETAGSKLYRLLPLLCSLLLVFFSYLPLSSSIADNARPAVALMCAYFWLVYRPDLFNLGVVFVFGMIADGLSAAPFGSGLAALLVMYLLTTNLIRYLNGRVFVVLMAPSPSTGWPSGLTTRPISSSPTGTCMIRPVRLTSSPSWISR